MKVVNIQEAKTTLSRLTEEAASGAEVVIAKAGKPMVRLVPFHAPLTERRGGQMQGLKIPSDFDVEDPEILRLFGCE